MTVSTNVIRDLLPLYVAHEGSEDTRKLVDAALAADPALAEEARKLAMALQASTQEAAPPPSEELKALARTQRLMRIRNTLMGISIFFTLAPLSIQGSDGQVHLMFADHPGGALICGILAVIFWTAYFSVRRRMRVF